MQIDRSHSQVYNTLGFKKIQKPCLKMVVSEHNVTWSFFEAWSNFKEFHDGFLSHEIRSQGFAKIKQPISHFYKHWASNFTRFSNFGQVKLSASVTLLTLSNSQLSFSLTSGKPPNSLHGKIRALDFFKFEGELIKLNCYREKLTATLVLGYFIKVFHKLVTCPSDL